MKNILLMPGFLSRGLSTALSKARSVPLCAPLAVPVAFAVFATGVMLLCASPAQADDRTHVQKFRAFYDLMSTDPTPTKTFCVNVYSTYSENPNGWGPMFTMLPQDEYPWEKCERQWRKLDGWFSKNDKRSRKRAQLLICEEYPSREEAPLRLQMYEDGVESDNARVMRRFYKLIGKERTAFLKQNVENMTSGVNVEMELPDDLTSHLDTFCEVNG